MTPVSAKSRTPIESAGIWFLQSGIQEPAGGVARYYRLDGAGNARISTEITGYAVSTLLYLFERTGQSSYLDAAARAGDFLANTAWDANLQIFPFEYSALSGPEAPAQLAYFFDCGIIVRGLLKLWEATGNTLYRDVASRTALSMQRDFTQEGVTHPILSLPSKAPLPYTGQWSRSPGCYQLKSALAWRELHELAGDLAAAEFYESAAEQALGSHESFLPAETAEKTVDRLHAYLYFLEGLLPCASQASCADALRSGIQQVGYYSRRYAISLERSDVYAQLLRIRLFAAQLGCAPLDRGAAEEELHRLKQFQAAHPDGRVDGSFYFGRKGGEWLPFANPVSTAFCLQAIEMWEDFSAGLLLDRRDLI
ncbi:MAG TPA: hypothetical protein VEQ63_00010 [Bryobacteraceae bacterium]|nr:hypothetical protein [Bryobacteraceae bacterium]